MKTQRKRYLRFCGIDVAKNRHVACIIDRDGRPILQSMRFGNDRQGYQSLVASLKQAGRTHTVLIGMEATGHYWYGLHEFLIRCGYSVTVLNPIQTAMQARKAIRKSKTDRIDAMHIAILLKSDEYKPALIPGELAMSGRQLTRLRYDLIDKTSRIKQLLRSKLHAVWPEYETLFANPFCTTGRTILKIAPAPQDVLSIDQNDLADLIRRTSRGKYNRRLALKLHQTAEHTVGMQRGIEGFRTGIRLLLNQLEALLPVKKQLEADIKRITEKLPPYILTLPGADPIRAVSLYSEIDPVETFTCPKELVAFAGLDPSVYQTGEYDAAKRSIGKRGSPFLRHTLWTMAHHAIYQEGDLREYWLRKRRQNKHHLTAVTAAAAKLAHITWRIMTDKRPYFTNRDELNS